jgi:hypothetical protein
MQLVIRACQGVAPPLFHQSDIKQMTYSCSVDGFGDSDDMALAFSKSEDMKNENFYNSFYKPLPTVEFADVDADFIARLRNRIKEAFESGEQTLAMQMRDYHWIGGDALDFVLEGFPIDIEWENYGSEGSDSVEIMLSWFDTDPETIVVW